MSGLNFWQSYGNIDIWFDTDTKTGSTKYMFWFQGQTYERESEDEIKKLARELYDSWFQKVNGRVRGGK